MAADGSIGGAQGLLERGGQVAAICGLLERLGDGDGGCLLFVGEGGLGKTTLLRTAEALAGSGQHCRVGPCRVRRANGVVFGAGHAFRFADQIFASLGAGLKPGPEPEDRQRSNRFLSALKALDDCSSAAPLVLLLDDLHWADVDSLSLVEFICHQIQDRPVGVVAALRPWPVDAVEMTRRLRQSGCAHTEELDPLSREASISLLASRIWMDVSAGALEDAASPCGGNPLLLEEVARSLTGGCRQPAVEPFSMGRRAILLRRFAGVSEDAFRFLRAASVLGMTFRPSAAARMVGFGAPKADAALEEAVAAGLVRVEADVAAFVHPAFGSALYDGLQAPLRVNLHVAAYKALGAVGGEIGEAAEHVLTSAASDGAAIDLLRRAGEEALRHGDWSIAVRYLGHAVNLLGDDAQPDLLRRHAEALIGSGAPQEAARRLQAALSAFDEMSGDASLDAVARGRLLMAKGQASVASGATEDPTATFVEAADILAPHDRALAVDALLRGAFAARFFVGPRLTMALAERAAALATGLGEATHIQIETAWGAGAIMLGRRAGLDILLEALDKIRADPSLLDDFSESGWWPLVWCSTAAASAENFEAARTAYELGFEAAERRGWPAAMSAYVFNRVDVLARLGHFGEALEELNRAEEILTQTPVLAPFVGIVRIALDLELGRVEEADISSRSAQEVLQTLNIMSPNVMLWYRLIRGKIEMAFDRHESACEEFVEAERVCRQFEIGEPCLVPWWVPAIGAYTAGGRTAELERLVNWLEASTKDLPCRWPRVGALAGKALLYEIEGRSDLARSEFQAADAAAEGLPMVLARAQVLVWEGGFLRRSGDLAAARKVLANAFELAESRSAILLARTARAELRSAGGRIRRDKTPADELTPRQLEVADLASMGRTNPEIGDALGIAPKTVEHHLEAIYARLGIRSRRDLIRRRYSSRLSDPEPAENSRGPHGGRSSLDAPDAGSRP